MKKFIYLVTCALACAMPFFDDDSVSSTDLPGAEFTATFNGAPLAPTKLGERERRFYSGFPGTCRQFELKDRPGQQVLLRYIAEPSRKLHSADGCYRASGYDLAFVENTTLTIEEFGEHAIEFSQFRIVESNGREYVVRQSIVSKATGRSYADAPTWYWLTMFSSEDAGPWLAITWKLPIDSLGRY